MIPIKQNIYQLAAMSQLPDSTVAYRPDIDGLRALAVLSVLLFHYFPAIVPGGFVGVDIFFVISGYLIGRSCLQEIAASRYSARAYFGRRARRIFPALLAVLAFTLTAGWFLLTPVEYELLGKHTAGASIFISNWQFWREVGYFNTEAALKPLLHLWSLAVEEQFYLLLPLFLALASRLRKSPLAVLAVIGAISFASSAWRVGDHKAWAYFHIFSRFWELALGILLAGLELRHPKRLLPTTLETPAAMLGLSMLLMACLNYSSETVFPGPAALLPTVGTLLIIGAGPGALANRALALRPVVYIGLISYPLYLWHWPLLSLLRQIDGMTLPFIDLVMLAALSFILAALTYHFIERPLRFGRIRSWRPLPILLWGLLLLLGACGLYVKMQKGLPDRLENFDTTLQAATARQIPPPAGFSSEKKAILLGDSHALMYASALHSYYYSRHGKEVIEAFRAGCKPFADLEKQSPGTSPMNCPGSVNPAIDRAINDQAIDTIIVVSSLISFTDMMYPGVATAPSSEPADNYPIVGLAFDSTFSRLLASGKTIVVFYTTPVLDTPPTACQMRPLRWRSQPREDCSVDRQRYDEMQAWSRSRITALAKHPNVRLFDPAPALCDAKSCRFRADGKLLYADQAHLNALGAERVAGTFNF